MEAKIATKFIGTDFLVKANGKRYQFETELPTPPAIGYTFSVEHTSVYKLKIVGVELKIWDDEYWYLVECEDLELDEEQLERFKEVFGEW